MFKIKATSGKVVKDIQEIADAPQFRVAVFSDGTEALFSMKKHTEEITEEDGSIAYVPSFCDSEGNLKVGWRTYKNREGESWLTNSEPREFENRLKTGIRLPNS